MASQRSDSEEGEIAAVEGIPGDAAAAAAAAAAAEPGDVPPGVSRLKTGDTVVREYRRTSNGEPNTGSVSKKHKKKHAAKALQLTWRPTSSPLRLGDVQNLVLWALTDGPTPRWCTIKPRSVVTQVVLLVAHGIDQRLWQQHRSSSGRNISRLLLGPAVVQARNATLVPAQTTHALLTLPTKNKRPREAAAPQQNGNTTAGAAPMAAAADVVVSPPGPQAKRMKLSAGEDVGGRHAPQLDEPASVPAGADAAGASPAALEEGEMAAEEVLPPLPSYVLTLDQLETLGYPLPQYEESGELACPEGFVPTLSTPGGAPPAHPVVALDCEMCTTEDGLELARCVLLDGEGECLLDMLVAPRLPILDYNTQYSGISEETLAGVTARVEDAQAAFRALVSAETVVVVHGGENDLRSLRVIHANVVDTVALFPHPKGPPARPALRVLASRFLRRGIQGGSAGHDPLEDARAALDLAKLKVAKGPAFGLGTGERGPKLADALGEGRRRGALVGDAAVVSRYVGGALSAVALPPGADDVATAEAVAKEAARPGSAFVWAQLQAVQAVHQERIAALKAQGRLAPCPEAYASGEWAAREAEALACVDAAVARVYDAAPPGTLLIVATGQGDGGYQAWLEQQRYERRGQEGPQAWGVGNEAEMRAHGDRAISALCFLGLKT